LFHYQFFAPRKLCDSEHFTSTTHLMADLTEGCCNCLLILGSWQHST